MILDFAFNVVAFILDGIAFVLPQITIFPQNLGTNIGTFVAYIYGWSWIAPVGTIITVFALMLVMLFAEFTYFSGMYVLRMIRAFK